MSYDLMVFERANAPKTKKEFLVWFENQTQWNEDHDYQTVGVSSQALQNWFMEIKDIFPPMNGEYTPDDKALAADEDLELHLTDYSIGREIIYAAFAWSVSEEAYRVVRELARKHGAGFFNVSGSDGEILLPDGSVLK